MKDEKFNELLGRLSRAIVRTNRLKNEVENQCIKRYGVSYIEANVEPIIDALEIMGSSNYTLEEFDSAMKQWLQTNEQGVE